MPVTGGRRTPTFSGSEHMGNSPHRLGQPDHLGPPHTGAAREFGWRDSCTLAVPAFCCPILQQRSECPLRTGSVGLRAVAGPAVDALVVALGDPDSEVRAAAAYALGEIGPVARTAVPRLRILLGDQDSRVRQLANDAILRIEVGLEAGPPSCQLAAPGGTGALGVTPENVVR